HHPAIVGFAAIGLHVGPPDFGAVLAIEAEEVAHQVAAVAGRFGRDAIPAIAGDIDAVTEDDRARSPRPRQLHLPTQVLLLAERGGKHSFVRRSAEVGTAELWPVRAGESESSKRDGAEKQGSAHELASRDQATRRGIMPWQFKPAARAKVSPGRRIGRGVRSGADALQRASSRRWK